MNKLISWAKKHKVWTVIIALVILGVIGSALGGESKKESSTPQQQPKPVTAAPEVVQETKPAFVFDIPTLVGKNIDEVRKMLGQPSDADPEPNQQQIDLGTDEWYNSYKKDGVELTVTFNPKTRKITDFFLSGDNRAKLILQGNLKENQSTYRIEEVKALRGGGITGIKIIPQR